MQQYRAYLKENKSKPIPKQLIIIELAKFIAGWSSENDNSSIIVMMDENSDTTDPHLQTFMAETGLCGTVKYHNPKFANQAMYVWGKKRLDYILVSENALQGSTWTWYTPFGYPFMAGHRGLYIDITITETFDAQPEDPKTSPQRGL